MVAEISIIEGPRFETATPTPDHHSLLLPIILSVVATLFLVGGFFLFDSSSSLTPTADAPTTETTGAVVVEIETETITSTVVETTLSSNVSVTTTAPITQTVRVVTVANPVGLFILEAQSGDGITHLARRAVERHLEETGLSSLFTAEHRVYMEDFVKDHLGSRALALGEEVHIETILLARAITAAQALTQAQLMNLSQYTTTQTF